MIHRVSFRAFVAATEDEERVREALCLFLSADGISASTATGHFGNVIKILEGSLRKKDALDFFRALQDKMPNSDRSKLRRELSSRVDDSCQLHFRLDKQAAYQGEMRLTDTRDAIDVTALIESYPARKNEAIRIAGELL